MRLCMGCMTELEDNQLICPYCGYHRDTPVEEAYYLTPGELLNERYVVGRVLGYGGFGVTYIGWDLLLKRIVAIKEYFPSDYATRGLGSRKLTVYSGDAYEQFQTGLASFISEAKKLAQFNQVEGIVRIYDCIQENETGYIIMEYLKGETVKEILENKKRYDYVEAKHIIMCVLRILTEVHKEGIIHRDIAPDNIFVTEDGKIKLLDFGAARYAASAKSRSLSIILKPGYAPEEQYRSHGEQGPWTDIYGVGATFYRMITGERPEESIERMIEDHLSAPSALGINIPEKEEQALLKSLNVRKENRYQNVDEFIKALTEETEEKKAEEIPKKESQNKDDRFVKSFPVKWIGLGIGITLAAGILFFALKNGKREQNVLSSSSGNIAETENKNEETEEKQMTEVVSTESSAESEAKAKQESESSAESEAKAKQEAESSAESEVKAKQESESAAESEAKAKQESESSAESEAKAKQEAESSAESEAKAKQESESSAESEAKAKQESESSAESEAKAKQESESAAESEAKAKQESESSAESEAKAKQESESAAESEAKAKQESESSAESEAKAKQESESAAESEKKAKEESEAESVAESEKKAAETVVKQFQFTIKKGDNTSTQLKLINDIDMEVKRIVIAEAVPESKESVFEGKDLISEEGMILEIEEGKLYNLKIIGSENEEWDYYNLALSNMEKIHLKEKEGFTYVVYYQNDNNEKVSQKEYRVMTYEEERIRYALTSLNVRKIPDTETGEVMAKYALGDEVRILGEAKGRISGSESDWYLVEINTGYGYVSADQNYTTDDKAVAQAKVEEEQRRAEEAAAAAAAAAAAQQSYSGGGGSSGGGKKSSKGSGSSGGKKSSGNSGGVVWDSGGVVWE